MERDIRVVVAENINRFWDRDKHTFSDCAKVYGATSERFRSVLQGKSNMNVLALQRLAELLEVNTISMFEDWSEDECN